jgi:fructokinase
MLVAGEALVDLVIAPSGVVEAVLGGAPYNTALAAGRLGADVQFAGGISRDRFGQLLVAQLERDGVRIDYSTRSERPSTLAAAEIDEHGAATYRFYFESTAAPLLDRNEVGAAVEALSRDAAGVLFTGGLGLVLEPMAGAIIEGIDQLDDRTLFMLDVNCRPAVIDDRSRYLSRVEQAARRADIVKVSDEDLNYLSPDLDLFALGAQVVVVTAGSSHTTVITAESSIDVPVPPISGGVVDTIGAGDTFGAGLLAWWAASGFGRQDVSLDRIVKAVTAGHAAAAVVVSRRGADPPYLHELTIDWPSSTDTQTR